MTICIIDLCTSPKIQARGLCNNHYMIHRNAGTLEQVALPRKYSHYLSDLSTESETAICSLCGPVKVRSSGSRRGAKLWRCENRARKTGSTYRRPYKYRASQSIGVTQEVAKNSRDSFYQTQNGLCAICGRSEDLVGTLHLDHCHTTNKLRGLLCRRCNIGLGFFDDDKAKMLAAIDYLK